MISRNIFSLLWLPFILSPVFAQRLVINEIMSANVSTITDEEGDYSDWIELFNADSVRVDLTNFGLSDDPARPFRWSFPRISLEPNQFLLLFASGKDIRAIPIHWETIIDWGDEWKYLVPAAEPGSNWRTLEFDDSAWLNGDSGFGYGDFDDATDVGSPDPFQPSPISVFIRKKINIEKVDDVIGAILHVDYDDAFVAYLNGNEIARANIGFPGVFPAFNQFATKPAEARIYRGGEPEKFIIANIQSLLNSGENVLALEVHNSELYSSDLTLIPFFTLEMSAAPSQPRGSSKHLKFPLSSKMHTNFKIKAASETILLSDANGKLIDQLETGYLPPDISIGRQPDGSANWLLFIQATPGTPNQTAGYQTAADLPHFSQPGGCYSHPIVLELTSSSPNSIIRYTIDGSTPTESSSIYTQPLAIHRTTVVRARAFGTKLLPSKTVSQTYLIDQNFTVPIISISTDPNNLWDHEIGIYVFGDQADTVNYPFWGSNFWQDWERPIHIEMFEPDGKLGFSVDAGVQIFGSWSRLYPQKSLAIYTRNRYGDDAIDYQIFPDKPIRKFQSIILRNSGQDWGRTLFRDAMMQYLVRHLDLDIQAYRPSVVFLNGEFWGIHNIREKMSEHYLASNRGVDPENIDFIERDTMVIKGDTYHYQRLLDFVETHDMRLSSSYEYVKTQMDVENFNNYMLSVIFFANSDWPWNNVKCWRPRTPNGKWKWLVYDLDYGFHGGHLGPSANVFNEIRNQKNGTTLLFFKLLENKEHQRRFANQFADQLNTTFEPTRVIRIINEFKAGIAPEMPRHITRWQGSFIGPWWLGKSIDTMEEWHSHIRVAIDFATRRPDYIRQHLMDEFKLWDGIGAVQLDIMPAGAGSIKLNSLILHNFPWQGKYFINLPIQLTALAKAGYQFKNWIGAAQSDSASIQIAVENNKSLTAVFEPTGNEIVPIVINEINYHSSPHFDTEDWLELHNFSDCPIDISGWMLKDADDGHCFVIPANRSITAYGYFILCRNGSSFGNFFPAVTDWAGNFDFGFDSKGELIRLFDRDGQLVDSIRYGVKSPWAESANGEGYSLELRNPKLDNSQPQSWAASTRIGGTPGTANSTLTLVPQPDFAAPLSIELFQNYPNPFNQQTTIQFNVAREELVKIIIYNLRGEEVKTLINNKYHPGVHHTIWDGTDKIGNRASSGLYFYCLIVGMERWVKKMLLIQ